LDPTSRGSKLGGGDGREWRDLAAAWSDSTVREEEERADRQSPHGSDTGERRRHRWNVLTKRGKRNPASVPRALGPNRLSDGAAVREGRAGRHGQVGLARSDPRERFQMEMIF
jgi:hypothetical protein